MFLFWIKKTEIVDVVVVTKYWDMGVGRGKGGVWKVRVRAVGFKQGTLVDGNPPP
jgi:hypothetical protein